MIFPFNVLLSKYDGFKSILKSYGNGQVSTRKNSTLSNAKSNPSLPTWDQFYASIKSVTSYYEDILNKNKSSGVTINPSQTDAALKKQLSDAESLAAKLVADNTKLQGNIDTLQSIIDKMKIDLANKIAQRYNSSSTTVDSSVYTESDLNINYAISNSDIASWQDISRQASGVTILDDLGLSINTQSTLSKMAQDAKDASSTEPDVTGNPLLNYSSNIVTIELPGPTSNTVDLRSRDIPMMHCNAKNEDTVASLKLVKYSMTIADNTQATSSEVRDALAYGKQTDLSNPGIIDLFETSNFMLQAASETDAEKVQIIDNFGAPQLFMFGRRPRVYNYSGYLWNNKNNNWKNEFRVLYDKYLRGTSCVDNGIKCLLTYDRSVRSGYILNCSINQISDMEMAVSFNFSMFVEDEKELVDESIFSTTDPSIQNAFSLANQQALAVESERDIARKAIEKKLTVDKPVITATTTKPDPGSLEMPPMTSTTIPMVAPKNAPTLTAQEAFKPSKYELNKPFNLYPAIQNTSDTTTQNTKASKAAIMGDSITAFTLGGPGAAIYYTISKAMTGNK